MANPLSDPKAPPRGSVALLSVSLLAASLWALHAQLRYESWPDVWAGLDALTPLALLLALSATLLNYAARAGYDLLSVRHAKVALPFRRVALASTLGFALSPALGFPLLTGAPSRRRLYGRWEVDVEDIGAIVSFSALTFWLGAFSVVGARLALGPPVGGGWLPVMIRVVGMGMLLGCGAYLSLVLLHRSAVRVGWLELPVPSPSVSAAQLLVGVADWLTAAWVLYALVPSPTGVTFPVLASAFVVARLAGLVSFIPGGIGVFEAVFLALMPQTIPVATLFAALIAYRIVYFLVPLAIAAAGLGAVEVYERRHRAARLGSAAASVLPTTLAALVFVLGATLLLFESTPLSPGRLARLERWVDPTTLNLSHFLASLLGAMLIVLARGLQRRLRGAHHVALASLTGMAVLSITGFAAPVLGGVYALTAILLWIGRDAFYRGSSLLDQAFTPRWIAAITITVVASVWLGLFSFRDVTFSDELWWRFTLNADAPRFLRASVGVISALLIFSLARLLRATPHVTQRATAAEIQEAEALVRASPRASANLALLGDKALLFSPSRRSFLMYAVQGSSWIAMGDPVGDEAEFEALLWDLRERADNAGDATAHYLVEPKHLHLYVDLGMSMYKMGEVGRVPLEHLTLEGKTWVDLRKARNRFATMGAVFEILPRGSVAEHLEELRRVSDDWLASKNTREKGFSLGRFDDDYIVRNPVAILRVEGELIAFASMWAGDNREEISLDLMRYSRSAPKGSMDCMFGNLLLWGRAEGYRYFWLGMAPLAGLEDRRLAPLWHRFGDVLFDHGERFYNFQGLYDFKEKFAPEWEPRYLAISSARRLPQTLADVAALVGGGLKGVVGK